MPPMLEIPKDVCEATCSALRDAHILAHESDKHLIADKINEALTMLERRLSLDGPK